jgi:hypothetical protein
VETRGGGFFCFRKYIGEALGSRKRKEGENEGGRKKTHWDDSMSF